MNQPTIVKTLPIAVVSALLATRFVHGRAGNEVFLCDGSTRCELGSGASWFFTGITLVGPFIALAGFFWARRLHESGQLGPFSHRAIPDGEQILEVILVLGAGLLTYWLVLNGPSIEFVEIGRPNTWVERLREFRAPESLTQADRQKLDEVPSRRTWFLIGIILGGPMMFSFGNMLGREWYGRKRRKAQALGTQHGLENIQSIEADIDMDHDQDQDQDLNPDLDLDLDLDVKLDELDLTEIEDHANEGE